MSPYRNKRWTAVVSGCLIGGLCGALLAAFGNTVSSTELGIGVTIVLTTALGAWLGRVPGAILGMLSGILLVAAGSVAGGSPLGAALTMSLGAALGGYLELRPHQPVWGDTFRPFHARQKRGTSEPISPRVS